MLSRLLILQCLFWLCSVQAIEHLAPYATRWDTTKGLTHNSVYDIERDAFGRLWLATPGGVSIVDGLGVIQLKKSAQKDKGIRFNPITQIHARDDFIWVLGLGGIELIEPKSLRAHPFPDPNKLLQRVTNMIFVSETKAYAVANRQLLEIDLRTYELTIISSALYQGAQVNSFAHYDQAHILLMTSSGLVLYNWQTDQHRLFNLENLARGKEDIRAIWVDFSNQHVWLSIFNKGLFVYDQQNRLKKHLRVQNNTLPSNMISNLQVREEQVYAVTKRGVVIIDRYRAIPKQVVLPTSLNNSYRNSEMALAADIGDNNELFIGTSSGFYHVSPTAYEFHALSEQAPDFKGPILTQFIDQDELVILTQSQQHRFSPAQGWQTLPHRLDTANLRFISDHTTAVKNFHDLALFNGLDYTSHPIHGRPDPQAPITYLAYLKDADIYVVVDDKYLHLAQFDNAALQVMRSFPLELASVIDTAYAHGKLYISSQRHGVMELALEQLAQNQPARLHTIDGAQAVTSLFLDSSARLWITTLDEGVFTLDTGAGTSSMKRLPLPSDEFIPSASCVVEDSQQRIWISSRHGVSVYHSQDKTLHSYTGAQGLGAIPITDFCGRLDRFIYFANNSELLLIDPERLGSHSKPTSITFTDLSIDGQSTPLSEGIRITDPSVIEFSMSASLPHDEGGQLLYRLIGQNSQASQWLPSRSRYITLIKPKPGQYRIQAKVLGYDSVEKAFIQSSFEVKPPFYLLPSMIALYIGLAFALVALGFVVKLRLKNAELALSRHKHQEQKSYAKRLAQEVAAKTELYKEQQQLAVKANLDKTRFIASASHDLRAPLNAIRLKLLNILPADSSNSDAIINEITLLDQLVDSIVSISKFDAKMVKPTINEVNLCALVAESVSRFSHLAQKKSQQLTFTTAPCEAWVQTDPFLLARVINNLVDNAIKNTPEKGNIELRLATQENTYTLAIIDSGKGINEAIKDKVFNSFFRGTESYAGSGLGLTIVQQICQILALDIELDSSAQGCTFTLTLPKSTKRVTTQQAPSVTRNVLIIDDEPTYANEVAAMVTKRGFAPSVFLSAGQALCYPGPKPEMVICDYHLDNGALGTEVASQIAARFALHKSRIIIMSEDIRIREQIRLNFGYRFLNKPIKYSRLSWLIQQLGDAQNNE
ncbi:hybrid sensor histidine kinase/response regulator [Pseudoalteromonas sp. T1lg76]|uniref:hybrid sensor histidine kinase/response regulator n=1 Tax=Pseudoalteromonas sp. T1lg76 TaxID=2077103 RepID=UPI000CF72836|nr:ATP-binding protein [Pseudoalteromonas sp. T1lg76]